MHFLVFVICAYGRDVLHILCAAETAYNYLCSMYFLVFVICAYGRDVLYIMCAVETAFIILRSVWE